jgi:hypothetical protein
MMKKSTTKKPPKGEMPPTPKRPISQHKRMAGMG